jgi:UDP-N-acetylmuramoyl-L-alanyl-D-glutamate--2,6-diaminopimelate ligase
VSLVIVSNNMIKNDKSISLGRLFEKIDCSLPSEYAILPISGLANDSRKVKAGDLFFAMPGFSADGRKFIPEAISLGAVAVVSETPLPDLESIPIVVCKNIRRVMSKVAARFFDFPSTKIPVLGVTGTNGKTTTTYLYAHIMSFMGHSWGRLGTVDYYLGKRTVSAINTTPDALDLQTMLAEIKQNGLNGCVMEVSSHGLDLGRCDDIEFAGAVFMNLTQDHLDYHKDMENYFKAKAILFEKLLKQEGFAVLNNGDPYSDRLKKLCRGKAITFLVKADSAQTGEADMIMVDEGYADGHRKFKATFEGRTIINSLPLLGKFNLYNASAAVASAIGMGFAFDKAIESLRTAPQVPGRVEKIAVGQPFEVVVDYAHSPDALENLLKGVDTNGEKILVFGCGGDRDKTKRPIMGQIASKFAHKAIVTTDNPRSEEPYKIIEDVIKGMPANNNFKIIENRDEAIGQALSMAKPGDMVIIAGKGHEDYQIIGKRKFYFSDHDIIRKYLKKMGYAAA